MPGIATHYLFGTEAYSVLDRIVGGKSDDLAAFLLGNQGPDPLFYLAATPSEQSLRRIGQTMHRRRTVALLRAVHERLVANAENTAVAAYALGFLCHYILDSTVHPLVYAQEHAICDSKGATPLLEAWASRGMPLQERHSVWSHRIVHATIETSIDEYVLTTKRGATAATMPPHKTMLRCPAETLLSISQALADVVSGVYEVECPPTAFATALGVYRTSQRALDSKSSGLRRRLDYLPKSGAVMAYVRALSHRPDSLPHTPFTNDDHIAWPHAFEEGEVVRESFDELYASSMEEAENALPVFAGHDVEDGFLEDLVGGVNFLGQCSRGE